MGKDRLHELKKHWIELNPQAVVLDDGYQHFAISRDLDILVQDFSVKTPFKWRDFPSEFKRADVRISFSDVPRELKHLPWVRARYHLSAAVDTNGKKEALPPVALAFCGLGNPERF